MPASAPYNIKALSNENLRVILEFVDEIDLDGAVIRMQIRQENDRGSEEIWSGNSEDDPEEITILNESGAVVINIPLETVLEWDFSLARYDVILDFGPNDWDNLVGGKIALEQGTTYPVD